MKKIFLISASIWVSTTAFSQTSKDVVCYFLNTLNNDAHVISVEPNKNYGQGTHLDISAGSWEGKMGTSRAFMDFDWNKIPNLDKLKLTQAYLNVPVYSESDGNIGNPSISLKRITTKWSENTITWYNQPAVITNNNSIVLYKLMPSSGIENIDVFKLVNEILKERNNSYGIQIAINEEIPYQSLFVTSSNYPLANKRPILNVCFLDESLMSNFDYNNPITSTNIMWNNNDNSFTVNTNEEIFMNSKIEIKIYDLDGKLNKSENCDLSSGFSKVYFNNMNKSSCVILKLHSGDKMVTKKIFLN